MNEDKDFLRQDNNYRTLKAFQKAECIYDVTYYFAHTFLKAGDRTIDQMVQAARSGKQNLAEGNIDGVTSREMEIKLTNVNRASLHELLLDYEDFLRVRGLEQWPFDDPRCVQTRAFCKRHLDSAIYREKIKERSPETIANIAITLITVARVKRLLGHLIVAARQLTNDAQAAQLQLLIGGTHVDHEIAHDLTRFDHRPR